MNRKGSQSTLFKDVIPYITDSRDSTKKLLDLRSTCRKLKEH